MNKVADENTQSYIEQRNHLLKDTDPTIVRKAWFTLSNLLLDEGAHVVDMGCDDGAMTYAMAALNPKAKFTGLDKSKRQINKAKEQYKLFNLNFKVGDASSEVFESESLDAIVNSYVLHEVYSSARYNEQIVSDTLRKQFKMLKKGGAMFIRDYARPPPDEFVLMEMPDKPSKGQDLSGMSEVDLLIWYAEHARPRQDAGCGGFFLEELPERIPGTRLFRLPYKWAYEFIMRKDDRTHWESGLPIEYTFFTTQDFKKELGSLGARVQYAAPHWDETILNERFEGRFRLYDDRGQAIGHPPTCFVAVAFKMAERKSLKIEERRPSSSSESDLKIQAMRNTETGELVDIVSRNISVSEVIPYRVDSQGRLKVYLHDGIARSISNAVPRGGSNIDGRNWSGHMVEPIMVEQEVLSNMEAFDAKNSALFARDYLGLKPHASAVIEHGQDYYPSPDYIDEKIHTYYLSVQKAKGQIAPKSMAGKTQKFQAKGFVREIDAQQALDAITVGLIPSGRLELQILELFQRLKITAENWTSRSLKIERAEITQKMKFKTFLNTLDQEDFKFKTVKGSAGQLRPIHSTFVEEGQTRGSVSGLSAEDVDFIVHDGKTVNTAVVLPLTKDLKGMVHAGFHLKNLPVPQRYEGKSSVVSAPSFNIPADVTTPKMLKKFIADQFQVLPSMVIKMGESYFAHVGVTPHKIYPYAVAAPPYRIADPQMHFLPYYQMSMLKKAISKSPHMLLLMGRAYRYFNDDLKLEAAVKADMIAKERFAGKEPDWAFPVAYETMAPQTHSVIEEEPVAEEPVQKQTPKRTAAPAAPKAFHQRYSEPPTPDAQPAERAAADIQNTIDEKYKPAPNSAQLLSAEFEAELEEFMEIIENELLDKPVPEKW